MMDVSAINRPPYWWMTVVKIVIVFFIAWFLWEGKTGEAVLCIILAVLRDLRWQLMGKGDKG